MADIDDRWYRTGQDGARELTARHGRGRRWSARWRDANGKQRSRAFERKLDAENFLAGLRADLMRGSYIDPAAGKITVKSYAERRWLPAQVHLRPNSASLYASHVANHVVPLLGDRPLGALRRPDCTAFVAALTAKLAPSTVHTVYAVLCSLMQSAVEDQLIAANPCSRVPLPRVDKRVITPLPAAAVSALAAAIRPRYEVTVWLAAGAGLREGEALGLTVPRAEFLARRLVIIEQRLGHATMAETMDTYGHLFPDASEHGRGALDAIFAPAGVRPMCARQRS